MPFARQLTELARWLDQTRPVWHAQPFKRLPPPWEADHPHVAAWARSLEPDALEVLERDPTGDPACPQVLRHWHATNQALSALPLLEARELPWRAEDARWVPSRKWGQLTRFAGTLVPLLDRTPHVVDWCCGKGHLGRALAHWSGRPVVGIERQSSLCREGTRMATRHGLPVTLQQGDVLAEDTVLPSVSGGALVALHACGPLTDAALAHAHSGGARLLAVSPCCLQALGKGPYSPRSLAAQATSLVLQQSDLYLAMGEEQVATPQVARRRRTELAWRSGLELILRERCGRTDYSRIRSVSARVWDGEFADFLALVDAREGLDLPPNLDAASWEARGWARSREARALGLARGCFRRVLEVWVAFDRAQALAEAGWQVEVGTFCAPQVTPRNLLIVGRR